MMFNATFTKYFSFIVAISFIGGENHQPVQVADKHYLINLYLVHLTMSGIRTPTVL